jgi:(2Fe-2S) ferredoxin
MTRLSTPEELEKFRQEILSGRDPDKPCITLCCGSACLASGSEEVGAGIEGEIKKQGLSDKVEIRKTGCHGFCERGPIIVNHPDKTTYLQIKPGDVSEIVSQAVNGKEVIDRLLYTDPETGEKIIHESEIPFYKHQKRLVFGSKASMIIWPLVVIPQYPKYFQG